MYRNLHSSGNLLYRCSMILMLCWGMGCWLPEAKGQDCTLSDIRCKGSATTIYLTGSQYIMDPMEVIEFNNLPCSMTDLFSLSQDVFTFEDIARSPITVHFIENSTGAFCPSEVIVLSASTPTLTCPDVEYPDDHDYFPTDEGECTSQQSFTLGFYGGGMPLENFTISYEIVTENGTFTGDGETVDFPFPAGTNTVTWTVTDGNEFTDYCSITVKVEDKTPPDFDVIQDLDFALDETGNMTVSAADLVENVTDNCSAENDIEFWFVVDNTDFENLSFDCDSIKTHAFDIVGIDKAGNRSAPKKVTFRIRDQTPPDFDVIQNLDFDLDETGNITVSAVDLVENVTDNCSGENDIEFWFVVDNTDFENLSFDCDSIKTHVFDIIGIDKAGNRSAPQSVTFTIRDQTPPDFDVIQNLDFDLDGTGNITVSAADLVENVMDNCSAENEIDFWFVVDNADYKTLSFNCDSIKTHAFDIVGIDKRGNRSAPKKVTFRIRDNTPPIVQCKPYILDLDVNTGQATLFPSHIDDNSTDNCRITDYLIKRTGSPNSEYASSLAFDCSDVSEDGISITLKVIDASNNSDSCKTLVTVRYYDGKVPAPEVVLNPVNGEICSNETVTITLNNPYFDSSTDWDWIRTTPDGISMTANDTIVRPVISYHFSNSTDVVDTVKFLMTPTIYNKCVLSDTSVFVIVNPHPKLLAILPDTICNNSSVTIPVQTSAVVSEHAAVIYQWTVANNPEVTNQPVSDNGSIHYVNETITQELNNESLSDQKVIYTVKPLLYLNGNKCSSFPDDPSDFTYKKNDTVIVMPTPVIQIKASTDTICNKQPIYFKINTDNRLRYTGIWESTLKRFSQDSIDINMLPINPQSQDDTFEQIIDNTAHGRRTVNYTFSPQIMIAPGKYCYAPENKNDTLVTIAVNPTPRSIHFTHFRDSICFMDHIPEIHLSVNNEDVFGTLRYNLWSVDDTSGALLDNVTGEADFTRNVGWNASIGEAATKNESDLVQIVTYHVYPFIEYGSSLLCRGDSTERNIYLAPELKFDMIADTYIGGNHISCQGFSDGSIRVENESGGWSAKGYGYQWTNMADSINSSVSGLSAGNYEIAVSDNVWGCETKKNTTLTEPVKLSISHIKDDPNCHGPTGFISVSPAGGIIPYLYSWFAEGLFNLPDVDFSIMDKLNAGVYHITVTDANECETSVRVELNYFNDQYISASWYPDVYGPDINGVNYNVSCHGANDGRIIANPKGIIASAYIWKRNDEIIAKDTVQAGDAWFQFNTPKDFMVKDLLAGVYELTVIDTIGCEFISGNPLPLTEPKPITFDSLISKYANDYQVKCYGAEDGRIEISNVAGAYGKDYQYEWSALEGDPGGIVPEAPVQNSLGAGIYQLIISNPFRGSRDGYIITGLCRDTSTYVLTQPPELIVKADTSNYNGFRIKCFGDSSGSISLDVSGGGKGAYSYLWSTEDGSGLNPQVKDQAGLSAGVYKVDIGYSDGLCTLTEEYPLLHSPERIQNDSLISEIKCNGDNNASITVNISGGVAPYVYLWSSDSPDVTITYPGNSSQADLVSGVYELLITDLNGCEKKEIYELTQPDLLSLTLLAEDMSCDPGNDGSIEVIPSGGTPDYFFAWDNGYVTQEISNLPEGTYTVTVTDANDCKAASSATIRFPSALTVTAIADTPYNGYHIDCFGNNNGKISVTVENGRDGYAYLWSSGDVTEGIDHVAAGVYSVTVTDRFNCMGSASITVTQPDQIRGRFAVADVTCYEGDDGSLEALVEGGVEPYHYLWSNNAADTRRIDGLKAGDYRVRIIDGNNCHFNDLEATVNQPPPFVINFMLTDAFCPETSDGEIWATVTGGTSPYIYQWAGITGAASPGLTGLSSGVYSLKVTDATNCTVSQKVEIGYSNNECLSIPNAFSPNDDSFNDTWEITVGDAGTFVRYPLGEMYPEAVIEVWDAKWGLLLYRSQKGYPVPWDGKYNGKVLPIGSYLYIIRLNNTIKPITGNVTIIR